MYIGLSDKTLESMRENKMKKGKQSASTKRNQKRENKSEEKQWECKRCGKCCKFIVIPVRDPLDLETEAYLMAHGIAHDGQKLIIPAVCQYLKRGDLRGDKGEYYCSIHNDKFANCRLGGKKECQEAQKAWALLNSE